MEVRFCFLFLFFLFLSLVSRLSSLVSSLVSLSSPPRLLSVTWPLLRPRQIAQMTSTATSTVSNDDPDGSGYGNGHSHGNSSSFSFSLSNSNGSGSSRPCPALTACLCSACFPSSCVSPVGLSTAREPGHAQPRLVSPAAVRCPPRPGCHPRAFECAQQVCHSSRLHHNCPGSR